MHQAANNQMIFKLQKSDYLTKKKEKVPYKAYLPDGAQGVSPRGPCVPPPPSPSMVPLVGCLVPIVERTMADKTQCVTTARETLTQRITKQGHKLQSHSLHCTIVVTRNRPAQYRVFLFSLLYTTKYS